MNMPIGPVAAGTIANPMTAGAAPAVASPLGGFEALLAALFGGEGQLASPLAKAIQPADGEAPAEGDADEGAVIGVDAAAAQTLLAAFATAPAIVAPMVPQSAPQGEADGAMAAPGAPPLVAQTIPTALTQAQNVPAQGAPALADAQETFPASLPGLNANAPSPGPATAAPTVAANVPVTETAAAPQDPLPDLAVQGVKPDPTTASASQPAKQPPAAPQSSQLAAASHLSAPKPADAPAQPPGAQSPTASVDGEVEPAAAPDMTATKPPATAETAPGLRKAERVDASLPPPAAQADAAPPPSHTHATAEAAPSASAASAHATVDQPAGVRGAPETVATLAAEILKKLDSRTTRFEMELEPHGLGKVDVRLEIGAHGRLTAAMAFENPQSAQELKNRSGELVRALEQAGFDVSDGLSFDVADNSNGSGQNNGAQEQTQDAPWRGRAFLAALETAGAADAPPIPTLNLARLRASGVDIKI